MKTIAIESPYAGDVAKHKAYLQACIKDCLARNESPYASHQMLTDALDDNNPAHRSEGIMAGLAMAETLDLRAFYVDYGWSDGMLAAKSHYDRHGIKYQVRSIL